MRRLYVSALRAVRACVVALPRSYDWGYFLSALRAWALAIGVGVAVPALAQEAGGEKATAFTASLVRIKSQWSTSPAAKEIEADLREALRGEKNAQKLLQELPANGAGIVFSPSAAVIYTKAHYAQLLAWLKARNLLLEQEPFEPATPVFEEAGVNVAVLMKNADFVQLESRKATSELFFADSSRFTWAIYTLAKGNEWIVERDFRHYEQARGQEQPKPANSGDRCYYQIAPLADGQVLIANAFPAVRDDSEYHTVEKSKGFLTLIVIEKGAVRTEAATEARLLLPEKVERINAKLMRGVVARVWSAPATTATESAQKTRVVASDNVMINWSESFDTAWGFSKSLGKWAKQELKPAAKNAQALVLDKTIAVWHVESAYYGYSSETGTWDVLRLASGNSPAQLLEGGGVARVHDGDDVYTFASATGRWSSPKGGEVEVSGKPEEVVIKVFTLRNTKAADAERLINQLFARKIQSVAADERTNSVVVSGPSDDLNIIYHILTRLDEPLESDKQWPDTKVPARGKGATGEAAAGESVGKLTEQYERTELKAADTAGQIRELKSSGKGDNGQVDKLAAELRKIVAEAFAARQKLHQAEAAQLQQRVAGIQKNLQTRERLSEEIIERRVKDLLDPVLKWEGAETTPWPAGRRQSVASSAQSAAAQAVRDKLSDRWKQVFSLYENGRIRLTEVLQAAKELNDAELVAATSEKVSRDARQAGLDRLKQVQSIVDAHVAGNLEPEFQKLAVDAEVLKAEAELAAHGAQPQPPVTSRAQFTTMDLRLLESLGLKVRPVTKEEAPEPKYLGCLKIIEMAGDSPVGTLQVGDVIVALQVTGTTVPNLRLAQIEALRGSERIQVRLDISAAKVLSSAVRGGESAPAGVATGSGLPVAAADASILRSAERFHGALRDAESEVKRYKQFADAGKTAPDGRSYSEWVPGYEQRLAFLREEYAAQLRLLQLEVQDAKSALESASQQRDLAQKQFTSGLTSRETVLTFERAVEAARLRLERAETLLNLYRKADSKQTEPEKLKPT